MPDPIRIRLNALYPAAYLESTGGNVVTSGGKSLLNGKFRLVVAAALSDDINFDVASRQAVVAADGSSWRLLSLAKTSFAFTNSLRIQDSPRGPWLECKGGWLIQPSKPGAMPLLSLEQTSVSLDGGAANPGMGYLVFHTRNGNQKIALTPPLHPENPAWAGFFVLPFENGFVVDLGSVSETISINHALQADVLVSGNAEVLFRIPSPSAPKSSLLLNSSDAAALRLRSTTTSGLMMAERGDATSWKRTNVGAHRLEASRGWLRSTKLKPGDIWLGHVNATNTPVAGATSVFASTDRLAWELSLPRTGDAQTPKCRVIYRNQSATLQAAAVDQNSRYYGLRIQGLGDRTGVQAILDPDLAVFDLDRAANGEDGFHPKSGGDVPAGDGTERSMLVPRRNPRDPSGNRILDVPVAHEMTLRCTASPSPTITSLKLAKNVVTLVSPQLSSAPVGIAARQPDLQKTGFSHWVLGLPNEQPELVLDIVDSTLRPRGGEGWLNPFTTVDPSQKYTLIEHPGTQIMVDGGLAATPREAGLATVKRSKTEVTTIKSPDGKEVVAYSAFFAILAWAGVRFIAEGAAFLDEKRYKVSFPDLTDEAIKDYVKNNGLRDLKVVYFVDDGPHAPGAAKGIHQFIEDNMPSTGGRPAMFLWPFTMGLSILLFEKDGGVERYCDEIVKPRKPNAKTGLGFDFSAETKLDPTNLGWSAGDLQRLVDDSPVLWPRGAGRGGSRLDPTDPQWRGFIIRDMPMFLPLPPIVQKELPFVRRMVDSINKKLVLDYGWRDETGPTWVGSLQNEGLGELFTPDSWKNMLQMYLMQIRIKGAAGSIVTAEGRCRIRLPRIKQKGSDDPFELVGTFGLDLQSGQNPITRLDISQDGEPIATDSIPGFSKVAIRRIATDLKTAQIELALVATPELASALPVFSSERPQEAFLAFDFAAEPALTISLALPSEIQTNLFGRWPLTLQAMSISFAKDQTDLSVELRIRARLNLGLAAFGNVGAEIVVTRDGDGSVHFNVEIDEIGGTLSVGSVTISGGLTWATKDGKSGLVKLTDAGNEGKERELWGTLSIKDPGVIGDNKFAVRIGNRGEASYWISSIQSSAKISFGIGELRNPALLLGHRVDLNGGLAKAVMDPTGSVLALLRPDGDLNEWLAKWQPSSAVGSVIAGSGYLHLQDQVASAPVTDGTIDPTKLSSIMFTDSGLVRVDGVAAMLGSVTLRFGIAIDYKNKRITAGLQAPTIKMPPEDPQYEIQAGYIVLGLGFGGDPHLRLSIGWSERIGNTEFERDWTKATKIYMKSMPGPINTVWGGYLAELNGKHVLFGFAVRAGWTWSSPVGGGIVKGSAELGVTLGGVFQFAIDWGGGTQRLSEALHAAPPMLLLGAVRREELAFESEALAAHAETIVTAMVAVEDSLQLMASLDLPMTAEIFGDIWGKASVEFLGVTLVAISVRAYARFRVCGTLRRGITQAKGQVGFEVSVTILCITYKANAQIDIVLVDGDCPLLMAMDRMLLPRELPAALSARSFTLPAE